MADARRARRHVHETNALSYGHFGTATYDDTSHKWTFLRQHEYQKDCDADEGHDTSHASVYFQPVDERIFNPPPPVASNPSNTVRPHTMNAKGLHNLFLNHIPDAVSVATSSPNPTYNLEFRHSSPAQKRPATNILALGHARSLLGSGMYSNAPATPIVAMARGPHNHTLLLLGFEPRQVEILKDAGFHKSYTLPFVGDTAFGQWCESVDAIIQVSSPTQEQGTQFLVVKPSGTTILCPMSIDAIPGALAPTNWATHPTSKHRFLDPCPAATIPSSRTGGSPHAHAAFNPDDQNMVAVVDVSGQWSTWKLTGSRTKSARIMHQVHLQGSNNLHLKDQHSSFKSSTLRGGEWHRITWVASPDGGMDHVLVCNRRVAAVFGLRGEVSGLVDMRLGPPSDRNVILEIKSSNRRRDHLFVLTTSRLMIFSSTEGGWKKRYPVEPLELAASWNHFRDRADFSLRMSILETAKESWILLTSGSGAFALMYRFGYESSTSKVISLEDPSIFHLPHRLRDRIETASDILLCPVKVPAQSQISGAIEHTFIKLIACTNDGLLIEALYKHTFSLSDLTGAQPGSLPILSLPRSWGNIPRSAKYIDEDDLDDFVVSKTAMEEHFLEKANAVSNASKEGKPAKSSIRNYERLLEYLVLKGGEDAETPWGATLRQAVERFEGLQDQSGATSVRLISDLVNDCSIVDLEADSRDLECWLDDIAVQPDIRLEAVSLPNDYTDIAHTQLLIHYNKLVTAFVQPLSDELTDRNRVNRERLVRQISGPTVLGTLLLRTKHPLGHSDSQPPAPAPMSDSAVPYPSPAPDSDDPELSQSSAPKVSVASEEPAVTRLREFVDVRHQVPPLLLDHIAGTSIVLGHLPTSIQEDPADYSYQQANQRMKLVQEQHAAASLDPKQRNKALKSAARLQRKLERNRLMGQEVELQRTLLPSIGTGTRVLPGRDVQSSPAAPGSSQMNSQDQNSLRGLTMTQPEKGAFGTREAPKKVKKRRAGF